jgi:protein-arginine kinase activator protein McsA
MNPKILTEEQLKEYENKNLTLKDIFEMEQRGFKIQPIIKLSSSLPKNTSMFDNMVKGMLEFAIENEYYNKAATLRDILNNK